MGRFNDLSGQTIGNWKVLSLVPKTTRQTKWRCECICGNTRDVQGGHLASGASTNCGCLRVGNLRHGQAITGQFSKKYRTWRSIKARCNHPSEHNKPYYEGKLCDAWQSFEVFDLEVPDPPSDNLTIDRIDNALGYQPGNVRWVTMAEQHRNQSNCMWIEYGGTRAILTDWARKLEVRADWLSKVIKRHGIDKVISALELGKIPT